MLNNKSYINGEWVNGLGKSFANINPSDTKDIISEYNECDSNQFNQAVEAAKKAQIEWASVGIEKKSNILINIGNELISKSKEIVRKLTPKECFRFQGFNNIKLPSDVARSQLYKQAGNSVTVKLVERIAKNIKKCLDNN